jgi:hypothetical protein
MLNSVIPALASAIFIASASAQESPAPDAPVLSVGASYHQSFIIQHTKKLSEELTQARPWFLEVDLSWHLRTTEVWDYCFCYPRTGFSFRYIDFGMPDLLGRSVVAYPYIEPFIGAGRTLSASIRFGLGPAWVSHVYDATTNPDNLFFSSHLSFLAMINATAHYRINDRFRVRLAANYNHISNGGFSEPNLGMNFPSVSVGSDYSFASNTFENRERPVGLVLYPKKNRLKILLGVSVKPPSPKYLDTTFPVFSTGILYSRVTGRIFAVSAGAEYVNDLSLKELVILKNIRDEDGELADHNRFSTLAGIEWLFGRFTFSQHLGVYLYSPVPARNPVYQRYGLSFRVLDHLHVGVNIKAHAQNADFIEGRLAASF